MNTPLLPCQVTLLESEGTFAYVDGVFVHDVNNREDLAILTAQVDALLAPYDFAVTCHAAWSGDDEPCATVTIAHDGFKDLTAHEVQDILSAVEAILIGEDPKN